MRQQQFEAQHQALWDALSRWLEESSALAAEEVPPGYRQLCHHLAVARERHYSPALVDRLQQLALRLHQRLYGARSSAGRGLFRFLLRDLPREVRAQGTLVLVSALLIFGPLVGMFLLVRSQPELVHLLLSPEEAAQYVSMYDPNVKEVLGASGASRDVMMFGFYIFNNIGIDFQLFASGLLAGVGPLLMLPMNGLHMGAVMGHLTNQGLTSTFYGFVSGHSSFELLGAVLAGAGGLRLGLGLVHPGRRRRVEALKEAARRGSRLLFGAALLTFLAAGLEGFWSANQLVPWKAKVALGLAFWALLLGWLLLAGRED